MGIDLLKDVKPEDIEDISERFLPMWQEGRESDSVKKIHLNGQELYLIALIEHQSKVHHNMSFRILRYIVMILNDYENEQEKLHPGITETKDFKYPPILPVIYYEGSDSWTAVKNQELIEKKDELSLIFLINKLRSSEEFRNLKEIPKEYMEHLGEETSEYMLKLIGKIIAVLLYRMNVPRKEVEAFTDQIMRREFDMLFDSFEAYDVQETRRVSREEGRMEERVQLVCKKLKKNKSISEIAEALEEDEALVQAICNVALKYAPDYDIEKIISELNGNLVK